MMQLQMFSLGVWVKAGIPLSEEKCRDD